MVRVNRFEARACLQVKVRRGFPASEMRFLPGIPLDPLRAGMIPRIVASVSNFFLNPDGTGCQNIGDAFAGLAIAVNRFRWIGSMRELFLDR